MKEILNECAYAALASDFAMVMMDIVWQQAQKAAKEELN